MTEKKKSRRKHNTDIKKIRLLLTYKEAKLLNRARKKEKKYGQSTVVRPGIKQWCIENLDKLQNKNEIAQVLK